MQKFIPIFPLAMVAYPGEKLHLHIFEQRYRQLINECLEEGKPFGLPAVEEKRILDYGTEMEVTELVKRYDSGELDIVVEGKSVFKVLDLVKQVPEKLYMGAVIDIQENKPVQHRPTRGRLIKAVEVLFSLLEIEKKIDFEGEPHLSYALGHLVGFDLLQEYELLKHPSEATRQRIILEHVRNLLPSVKQVSEIRERARLNGHFRLIHPPDIE
jgi:Lon protease-like protein